MPLDVSKQVLDLHVLVTIFLSGTTLRYADQHITLDDGSFYEGRADIPSFRAELPALTDTNIRHHQLTLRLRNQDGGLNAALDTYHWGNREVEVRVGEGTVLTDYSLEFAGYIQFPHGIRRTN